jgi:hypothetical protein
VLAVWCIDMLVLLQVLLQVFLAWYCLVHRLIKRWIKVSWKVSPIWVLEIVDSWTMPVVPSANCMRRVATCFMVSFACCTYWFSSFPNFTFFSF